MSRKYLGKCSFGNCSFVPAWVPAWVSGRFSGTLALFVASLSVSCDEAKPQTSPASEVAAPAAPVPEKPWYEGRWGAEVVLTPSETPPEKSQDKGHAAEEPAQKTADSLRAEVLLEIDAERQLAGTLKIASVGDVLLGQGLLEGEMLRWSLSGRGQDQAWVRGALVAKGDAARFVGTLRLSRLLQEPEGAKRVSYSGQVQLERRK